MNGEHKVPRTPPTRGRRTPPATPQRRGRGLMGRMPPSGFCKAGKLECYPRPVSIWCPPAHKAITMFLADRCRSSIRITAFYGALPLRHAGFFSPPSGIELGSSDCVCFFVRPSNHYTTPPIQRISPKVEGPIWVYEAGNQRFPAPLLP